MDEEVSKQDEEVSGEDASIDLLENVSKMAIEKLSTLLVKGAFTGEIGDRDTESMNYSDLVDALEKIERESAALVDTGNLSVEATFLVTIGETVVKARKSFMEGDLSTTKAAIIELKEISEEFAIPSALEEEMQELNVEIVYRDCLQSMQAALVVETPVQYLVSMVKSRKRTVSTGKVLNTTMNSPGNPSNNGGALEVLDEILQEEDLALNDPTLEVQEIERALRLSSQVQDTLESEELPDEFFHHISALEAIKNLRVAVKSLDFSEALSVISTIERSNLKELVPAIVPEVEAAVEPIGSLAVISACRLALSRGQPQGTIGLLEYKSISLDQLEEAIRLCQTVGCSNKRAEELYKAVLVVTDLRRAQKNGDWEGVRAALKRAEAEGVGNGATELCLGEMNRSTIECDNHDLVQKLKDAMTTEEVSTVASLLDLDNASVNELSTVYAKASAFPDDTRGVVLKALMGLAEVVLKARRAAIQKQWFLVESLIPVVKDYCEQFQNDIEKSDRVVGQRKTVAFRSSAMFRQSVLARPGSMALGAGLTAEGATPGLSPSGSPIATTPSAKSVVLEEFSGLLEILKREIKSIENHFLVLKLEVDLTKLLKEHGIQSEVIGSIDKELIKTDELQAALQIKTDMEETGMVLPEAVQKLGRIAQLVVEMRQAVLAEKWDTISAMLEETLNGGLGTLPEYTRGEILIVRKELENRWIVSNLTNALQTGKLEGELGKTNLANVSCEHLMSYISTAKSLNPRTDFALLLLYTAESIYPLRKLLTQSEVDWPAASKLAKKLIQDTQQRQKIHLSVLPELKLIHATAEDTILCNAMRAGLASGGPTGQSGDIDITPVSTQLLVTAGKLVARSTLKTEFAGYLNNTCQVIMKLRESLMRTQSPDDAASAWSAVQMCLAAVTECKTKAPADDSWAICQAEIDLVEKHVHIEEIKSRLLDCVIKTSTVYGARNASAFNRLDPQPDQEFDPLVENSDLFVPELDAILEYAKNLKFESEYLDRYVGCATTLRLLRQNITKSTFSPLEELLRDPSVRHNLKILPQAEKELAWIMCEYHNYSALNIITKALKTGINEETVLDPNIQLMVNVSDFTEHNEVLDKALQEVKKFKITSKAGLQLLECCKNVLQLRRSLQNQDNELVAQSLRWFQANANICPVHIQFEAQQAYVLHQNDLLSRSLTAALAIGKPLGPCGELHLADVQTAHLEDLLHQAREVDPKFPHVDDLCEAAAIAVMIRTALLEGNLVALKEIVDEIGDTEQMNLLIVDEIGTARAELDNDVTTTALADSLKSFDDAESKALDMTFFNNSSASADADAGGEESPGRSARPGYSILQTFSQRRYSFANKGNANIDPETIDIHVLDRGLRIAEDHGVLSARARALYRTVNLVRSLRLAMKESEWPRLEEILSAANFEEGIGVKYDHLAMKEIQALKSQLEMRAAIVDLSKSLKVGWAKCSNGIVDVSTLCNDVLENAIARANRSLTELSINTSMDEDSDTDASGEEPDVNSSDASSGATGGDGKPRRVSFITDEQSAEKLTEDKSTSLVQGQVNLLMESAKLVLSIRETLQSGRMEQAGQMSEEALNGRLHYSVVDELKLYAKEINSALNTMRIFESLRSGMQEGSIEKLADLIHHAKNTDVPLYNDLGMIRALDRAEDVYYALLDVRKQASALSDVFDPAALRSTIAQAERFNMAEQELEQTRSRLEKLLAFEELVEEVTQLSRGVLCDSNSLELIIRHAAQLQLSQHPLAKSAELRLRFTKESFRSAVLADGIVHRNLFVLATETIRLKRHYLQMSSSQVKYALENFPNLRKPEDFGIRMNIVSEELRRRMLLHSDQPLPTSLTKQSPVLAALSVTVFAQYIRGIERDMYSEPGVVLRRMIQLGRAHPPMRDELLLLAIKQMRTNMDVHAVTRLWKCLSACLYHFPPSLGFESYLELFLIQSGTDAPNLAGYTQRCIRYMHQSIIRFGYNRKITVEFDNSIQEMRLWFQERIYDPPASQIHVGEAEKSPRGKADATLDSLELIDPAFMAVVEKKPPGSTAGSAAALKPVSAVNASTAIVPQVAAVRGSREDWIARFRLFNNEYHRKDGGQMSKNSFSSGIATSIAPEARVDEFDRDIFYFLLFGKHVSNFKAVVREFNSADVLFHSTSDDEIGAMLGRREWLDANVHTIDKSSEVFFSQLKGPDLGSYADRFWDSIIERMSTDCIHFPFLHWDGDPHRKPSILNSGSNVTINWELYREIVLTGMKKYIERSKAARTTVTTTSHEDKKLTGFTMHHIDVDMRRK
eukprot:gene11457-13319_t